MNLDEKPNEKSCPFCGETIKAVAVRCRYCHADLTAAPPSLLPPPAPAPAAEALGNPPPVAPAPVASRQVLDLLAHLVDKNLVAFEEDEEGRGRYRLLETVRQYARDRLLESDKAEPVRERHRDFFLSLAEETQPNLRGPEAAQWLDTLETEHDNLRAALEWCLGAAEEGAAEAGLRLSGALSRFWWTRGYLAEGRERFEAALSGPGTAQERTKARAEALSGAGTLAWVQGDFASARALLEEGLAIRRELGDRQGIATSLGSLGLVADFQGDYAAARFLLEESLAIATELANKQGIAFSIGNLGNVAVSQGDYAAARSLYEQSLATARESGNKWGVATSLSNLGNVAVSQGDYAAARSLDEESLALRREIGDKHGMALSLSHLGKLARKERDYATSRRCLAECLTLCRAMGEKRVMAFGLEGFAALAQVQEQPARAVRLYGASDALHESIGAAHTPHQREEVEAALADLRAALGEEAFEAAWSAGRALTWEQAVEHARNETEEGAAAEDRTP